MKIQTSLYQGKVQLTFTGGIYHIYHVTDEENEVFKKRCTSVTTFLGIIDKPALKFWATNMCADTIKEKIKPGQSYDEIELETIIEDGRKAHTKRLTHTGKIGTLVHNWCEDYINGKNPPMPINKELAKGVTNFLDWIEKYGVKFLLSEQQIYSRKYGYTGTLDFICSIDKKMYLGDIKTAKKIYPTHWIQNSAYRLARTEEYPQENYAGELIIRIGRDDGSFGVQICEDKDRYEARVSAALYALHLHKKMKEIKTYKVRRLR